MLHVCLSCAQAAQRGSFLSCNLYPCAGVAVKFITEYVHVWSNAATQFHKSKVVKSTLRIKILLPGYATGKRWCVRVSPDQ